MVYGGSGAAMAPLEGGQSGEQNCSELIIGGRGRRHGATQDFMVIL